MVFIVPPQGAGSPRGAAAAAGPVGAAELPVEEMAERLIQTEQLVSQLKGLIREKDATLRSKDDQLKVRAAPCQAPPTLDGSAYNLELDLVNL